MIDKKITIIIILFLLIQYIHADEHQRNYNDQISFIFDLSDKFTVVEIGAIQYPDHEYTLYKITYGRDNAEYIKKYLFLSGIHGIEIAPVYEMKHFMQYLDSVELIDDIKIDFIYIVNPWGFEHNDRHNGNGIDLNRDFADFETEEIQCLINSIKDETYTGMYDFHEHSKTTGFLLYYYSGKNKRLADDMLKMIEANGIPLENEYVDIVLKTKKGAINVPFYAKIYYAIKNWATSGLYFDKIKVKDVFVFETPMSMEMEKRRKVIDLLLQYIVGVSAK
jgi:hypothetical protein